MADQPRQVTAPPHAAAHLLQYHDLIESIVSALDARDTYTASHSNRVADMVLVLAAALGLDPDETALIHIAAHLHDIGKIAVPDAVLRKTGPPMNGRRCAATPSQAIISCAESRIFRILPCWSCIIMSVGTAAATPMAYPGPIFL